jgi:hypothetical protein
MAPSTALVRSLPPPNADIVQPVAVRSAKVMSLLLVLEALGRAQVSLDRQKV